MSVIPNLNNLIQAIECDNITNCKNCPYSYQYLDDTGDNSPFWWHDENKIMEDTLFYLKLYQHLIEENNNE